MRLTRANIEEYARAKGWQAVQIDGIPEPFSYQIPDITIGGVEHKGGYVTFDLKSKEIKELRAETQQQLLKLYKQKYG